MHNVQVLSGIAWITVDGQDVVAERGSCVQLPQNAFPALVSRLGGETLVFEIW
jgi:quercetin dioxygenase-like cupin family protein